MRRTKQHNHYAVLCDKKYFIDRIDNETAIFDWCWWRWCQCRRYHKFAFSVKKKYILSLPPIEIETNERTQWYGYLLFWREQYYAHSTQQHGSILGLCFISSSDEKWKVKYASSIPPVTFICYILQIRTAEFLFSCVTFGIPFFCCYSFSWSILFMTGPIQNRMILRNQFQFQSVIFFSFFFHCTSPYVCTHQTTFTAFMKNRFERSI